MPNQSFIAFYTLIIHRLKNSYNAISLTQIIAIRDILLRPAQPEGVLALGRLPLELRHVQVGPIAERHVRTRPEITQVCKIRYRYGFFYSFLVL